MVTEALWPVIHLPTYVGGRIDGCIFLYVLCLRTHICLQKKRKEKKAQKVEGKQVALTLMGGMESRLLGATFPVYAQSGLDVHWQHGPVVGPCSIAIISAWVLVYSKNDISINAFASNI